MDIWMEFCFLEGPSLYTHSQQIENLIDKSTQHYLLMEIKWSKQETLKSKSSQSNEATYSNWPNRDPICLRI